MADIVETLNDLIACCRDSEEGFGKAAKGCHSEALRNRLIGIARQRADFAGELAGHVRKLNGAPASTGHQSGVQHEGWRQLEESIRPKDDGVFVAQCIQGEENTLRHYETALTRDLPVMVRPVVDRQRLAVQETLLGLRNVQMARTA